MSSWFVWRHAHELILLTQPSVSLYSSVHSLALYSPVASLDSHEIRYLLSPIISVASETSSGIATANGVDGNVVRKEVIAVQPRNRLLSQFRAVTCFILADYVVDLVGIEFPLLTIMSAASANSSGIAFANSVDGNAVRKAVWLGFL